MTTRLLTVPLLGLLAAGLAHAGVTSGPKEAEKIAPLKVYAVTGDPKDKELDYAALRKDRRCTCSCRPGIVGTDGHKELFPPGAART